MNCIDSYVNQVWSRVPWRVLIILGLTTLYGIQLVRNQCDATCQYNRRVEIYAEALAKCGAMIQLGAFKAATDCFNKYTDKLQAMPGPALLPTKL